MMMILLLVLSAAWADKFQGQSEMNGITYKAFAGFEDKWKFVTVRFRGDTKEQRFVWANPKAVAALEAGQTDYPDGAVFAKIGFATEEDPAFRSSLMPNGSKRYQFMVRNRKKYADTGGWGYALFDGNKVTYDGDHKYQAQACFACHQLVTSRGQVFSVPMKITAFAAKPPPVPAASEEYEVGTVKFATEKRESLAPEIRMHLPDGEEFRSVQGQLRKHLFRGTIDEIRPQLIDEAKRSGLPAALIGEGSPQFALIYQDKARKDCSREKSFKSVFATEVPSQDAASSAYNVVATQKLCL